MVWRLHKVQHNLLSMLLSSFMQECYFIAPIAMFWLSYPALTSTIVSLNITIGCLGENTIHM